MITSLLLPPILSPSSIADYVQRYATKEAAEAAGGKGDEEEDDDDEMSDVGSFSDEEEPAGRMEL